MELALLEHQIHLQQATWQKIVAGLRLFIGMAIVLCCWIVLALKSHQLGWDFPVFYIAAHLPVSLLYNSDAFAKFWQDYLKPIGVPHWAPYVRLSLFSFPLRPILHLPYYLDLSPKLSNQLRVEFH